MNRQRSSTRWAIGTLAVVVIALAADSLRRSGEEYDAARAASKVVWQQLDAFNEGDYRAAYRFAAPEIRAQFPLPAFRRMVETGYPQIARSRSAAIGPVRRRGHEVEVPVKVTGTDGVTVQVLYLLRHDPKGWCVTGVLQEQPPGGTGPSEETPPAETEPESIPERKGEVDSA